MFLVFSDPSLHFLAAQGEIAKIKEEIDKGVFTETLNPFSYYNNKIVVKKVV